MQNWQIWYRARYHDDIYEWHPERVYEIRAYALKRAEYLSGIWAYREVIVLPYGQKP